MGKKLGERQRLESALKCCSLKDAKWGRVTNPRYEPQLEPARRAVRPSTLYHMVLLLAAATMEEIDDCGYKILWSPSISFFLS